MCHYLEILSIGSINGKGENERMSSIITKSLEANVRLFKDIFNYPENESFSMRELCIEFIQKNCVLLYMKEVVNEQSIEEHVLKPLINCSITPKGAAEIDLIKNCISTLKITKDTSVKTITNSILDGNTVLLAEGSSEALVIATIKYEHRSVERSETENIIKGPHESFVEDFKTNCSMIKKHIKSENLITESMDLGYMETNKLWLMYRKDIIDPDLIAVVKKRLERIKSDGVLTTSILGQLIEDNTYSIVPTILYTELPDRAVSYIKEGHVVILMDNSPSVLVAPATFWSFFHTPEDTYQRWIAGNFIRLIRILAIFCALLAPAIYLATTNYHPEMIPTDLLIAIARSRELVPFPVVFEIAGMELAFEIIREASIRIPVTIGSTIGIVGTLVLGQAAVQANIISPLIIIVVALTGVASFSISNTDLNMSVRILRFFFSLCAIFMGFLGLAIGIIMFLAYASSIKSFGVPFFSPVTPHKASSKDMLYRTIIDKQIIRPVLTNLRKVYKRKIK